jgi:hypothetical protein
VLEDDLDRSPGFEIVMWVRYSQKRQRDDGSHVANSIHVSCRKRAGSVDLGNGDP